MEYCCSCVVVIVAAAVAVIATPAVVAAVFVPPLILAVLMGKTSRTMTLPSEDVLVEAPTSPISSAADLADVMTCRIQCAVR